jgi:hypothetical protein
MDHCGGTSGEISTSSFTLSDYNFDVRGAEF